MLIISGKERSKMKSHFDQLFKLRYEIFVKRRAWSIPHKNGFEIDQYDNDDAFYFIEYSSTGEIEASARMTPSVTSSLMADYFPHLNATAEPTRSPHIYEATRYIIQPKDRSPKYQRQLKSKFLISLVEWCMEKNLTHLQSVIDKGALPSFVEMSMLTQPLGLPQPFGGGPDVRGGGECLGFRWPITHELINDLAIFGDADARSQEFEGLSGHSVH